MDIQKEEISKLEQQLELIIRNMKHLENFADNVDQEAHLLFNDQLEKKSYKENLNHINNRNDQKIVNSINVSHNTMAYIKHLENTLEIIMQRYREHTQQKIEETKHQYDKLFQSIKNCPTNKLITRQDNNFIAIVHLLQDIMSEGEELTRTLTEENAYLRTENKILRQLPGSLKISAMKEENNNDIDS